MSETSEQILYPEMNLVRKNEIAASTYYAEKKAGRGPKVIKIGRRNYSTLAWWNDWIQSKAAK